VNQTQKEIAERAWRLVKTQCHTEQTNSGPISTFTTDEIFIQYDEIFTQNGGGELSVHFAVRPDHFVEVYREVDNQRVPQVMSYPDREFMTLQALRRLMVLDDLSSV